MVYDVIERGKCIVRNNANLVKNIFASSSIKGFAIVISLLTIPAYMRYFADARVLGIWFTLLPILESMSIMDFGLGNGLRNQLVAAIAKKDDILSKELISSSYIIITIISLISILVGRNIIPIINWNSLLGIRSEILDKNILINSITILFISIMLQLIFKLINSILYAMQKSALTSLLPVCTNLCMLIFVLITKERITQEKLLMLAKFYCIVANIPYLIMTVYLFTGPLKKCRPNLNYANIKNAKRVMKLGILFFYLSFMSMITHNTNEFLISVIFNSSVVVEYQVYNKIFQLILTALNIIMIPLWSAVTKAKASGNYIWLKKLHKLLCNLSILVLGCGILIIPFMQNLVNLWLGKQSIEINLLLCIPFAIYIAEEAFNGANATIANGTNWIKAQIYMAPVSAILNIPLTFFFCGITESWSGIMLANICSLFPIAIVQFYYIKHKFKYMED